jgi:hypothetical protein
LSTGSSNRDVLVMKALDHRLEPVAAGMGHGQTGTAVASN